ncbi:MAG TPA: hypothetical protein VGP93_10605, partial [Polyangiaceae bacterium]|nr:hypothetical protein [Polyangiaceae bacterium]
TAARLSFILARGGRTTMRTLRSRLLVAMGIGTLAGAASGCGGDSSTDDGGAGGSSGATASGGAAGSVASGGSAGSTATGGAAGSVASGGTAGSAGSSGTGGSAGATAGSGGSAGETHFCEPWPSCATVRRPFLVGADMRSSLVAQRDDWAMELSPVAIPHARTAEFLAASWLKDALEEHASVAAFARFTMLLLSVAAPPELIVASQRASLDEVWHARACFALARRYGSCDVGPAALHVADSLTAMSLAELTALTVAEGCVGETLGALLAAEQLTRTTDPEVRRVLSRIEKDEARHAELAWKFLAWALESGGPDIEAAALSAFESAILELEQMKIVDYGVDIELWHAHGRVTCAEARALGRAGIEQVIRPCLQALLANTGRQPAREKAHAAARASA